MAVARPNVRPAVAEASGAPSLVHSSAYRHRSQSAAGARSLSLSSRPGSSVGYAVGAAGGRASPDSSSGDERTLDFTPQTQTRDRSRGAQYSSPAASVADDKDEIIKRKDETIRQLQRQLADSDVKFKISETDLADTEAELTRLKNASKRASPQDSVAELNIRGRVARDLWTEVQIQSPGITECLDEERQKAQKLGSSLDEAKKIALAAAKSKYPYSVLYGDTAADCNSQSASVSRRAISFEDKYVKGFMTTVVNYMSTGKPLFHVTDGKEVGCYKPVADRITAIDAEVRRELAAPGASIQGGASASTLSGRPPLPYHSRR